MKISEKKKEAIVSTLTPLLSRNDGTAHLASTVIQNTVGEDGGPGSGNWGHEGVEGQVGGSAPGGGKHNRITSKSGGFTSFAKRRKKLAKPHIPGYSEIVESPIGTRIIGFGKEGEIWEKISEHKYKSLSSGSVWSGASISIAARSGNIQCQISIPKSADPSYSKAKPHELTKEETLSQPIGATVNIGGVIYKQNMKGIWDNVNKEDDFLFSKELYGEHGQFSSPGAKSKGNGAKQPITQMELWDLPKGAKLTGLTEGEEWEKFEGSYFINNSTGEVMSAYTISQKAAKEGLDVKIHEPPAKKSTAKKSTSSSASSSTQGKFVDTPSGMGSSNGDECFTPERKAAGAIFEKPQDYDNLMRAKAGEIWKKLGPEDRRAFERYTEGYSDNMNSNLRGESTSMEKWRDDIDCITDTIEKSELPRDVTLTRGCGTYSLSQMLGCDPDDFHNKDFLESLVGRTMTDKGFMSCGSAKGRGLTKKCRLDIFCPKGTKGMYVEPFSVFGNGAKVNWDKASYDGESKQSTFSKEFETILQRGTTLRITGTHREGLDIVLECEVVKQNPERI